VVFFFWKIRPVIDRLKAQVPHCIESNYPRIGAGIAAGKPGASLGFASNRDAESSQGMDILGSDEQTTYVFQVAAATAPP
jgi:hypothetical protein